MGKRWKSGLVLVIAIGIADYIYITRGEMRSHRSTNDLNREEVKKIENEYKARRDQYVRAQKFAEEQKHKETLSAHVNASEDQMRTENQKLQALAKKLVLENQPVPEKESEESVLPRPEVEGEGFQYVSKEGDTLLSISQRLLGSEDQVEDLIRANPKLTKEMKIPKGTVIRIPAHAVEVE